MRAYLLHILIALDQLGTAIIGGYPDETLSSYAARMREQGKPWGFLADVIDTLWRDPNHCADALQAERERRYLPPELR